MKREIEEIDHFETWEAVNIAIAEYIDGLYNFCRRHLALHEPSEF